MDEVRAQPSRKRPWFQFHLSTLLLFSTVTGMLMSTQFTIKKVSVDTAVYNEGPTGTEYFVAFEACGWPDKLFGRNVKLNRVSDGSPDWTKRNFIYPLRTCGDPSFDPFYEHLFIDVATVLGISIAGSFCFAWLVNQIRKLRKPVSTPLS